MKRVVSASGCAEATLWRAIAGGQVHHSTSLAIEAGLRALESGAP
jgi:hypothetical protein